VVYPVGGKPGARAKIASCHPQGPQLMQVGEGLKRATGRGVGLIYPVGGKPGARAKIASYHPQGPQLMQVGEGLKRATGRDEFTERTAGENRSDGRKPAQRVKPEAQAAEGSLDAPEAQKPTQVGSCLAGRFRKMQEPVETEYSSTASPSMQGSVETRSASEAQPEKEPRGASREVHGR
jgi:hypothetical protein